MFRFLMIVLAMFALAFADNNFDEKYSQPMSEKEMTLAKLNVTTGGPYTYAVSSHHFYGTAFDGSWIDTKGCCCGQSGSCRNNPSCQCQVSVGPLPAGTYTLGNMYTFKGMPYCYDLHPSSSNNMCGRSGFLIHGGGCSSNPSEGCIVIEDQNTRYMIKSGATLKVVN
mmetsp:Transcript_35085/g.26199  ORF Transcript_35085/g.26199 Transcript_35085/m.26199 type:complete len:168 (+) Transcript_35085:37-540(+)|eukprot:CAMPEP_0202970922 /NCGR_PEP_ID=MMETSP1396-20130829/21764_1 /ASSEMBLY_ACC=CAM_ASM_000872 /TAXON_ID= /ORGANISM="Pseudokeronopsis sp., Strain Brazil" /LENGTH=167 /DNA_ID=CAMNT_0049699793 /DNA_START=34 /DNA_END=537 /DNA_ORIENTATION=-